MIIQNQTLLMTSNCKSDSLSRTSVKCSSLTHANNSFAANVDSYCNTTFSWQIFPQSSSIHLGIDIQKITLIMFQADQKIDPQWATIFIQHSQPDMRGSISS